MPDLPGRDLARELIDRSEAESRSTPVEAVIAAVREGGFDDDKAHRLIGRLWTLERMFYYIYGGWGQGLEMNDSRPPSNTCSRSRSSMNRRTRCSISTHS
jgi:hypothetical protein